MIIDLITSKDSTSQNKTNGDTIMTTSNKLKTLLFGALLSVAVSQPASAVALSGSSTSGTADVSATVPEFIILHYYSGISMKFDTPSAEAIDEGTNDKDVSWLGDATGGEELAAANLANATLELDGTKTTVKLPNVWAIRGFSKTGTALVSVTVPSGKGTLSNGASEIVMSNLMVSDSSTTDSSITTKLNGITKGSATIGNVLMDLNFEKTTRSGLHSGGQYTITASAI
jgi:hypothetical protein